MLHATINSLIINSPYSIRLSGTESETVYSRTN